MNNKYTRHITSTPQTRPAFGRTDMKKNSAGGYGFQISDTERLERFLLIGSEGGTYYASENKLTVDNAQAIVNMIKSNGAEVVRITTESIANHRAPKIEPALFVIALCMTHGDAATKRLTYQSVTTVCKTSTHLFTLTGMINDLRGWSNGLRRAISRFYLTKTPEQIAYQLVKYRQRNGYTHRDILRLAHPRTSDEQTSYKNLFNYACGKETKIKALPPLIGAFEDIQKLKDATKIASLVEEFKLTWEMVPTEMLKEKKILQALIPSMPLTALIRNLNRFANADLTTGLTDTTKIIVDKLRDKELIKKAGLHPVNVCNSMLTYARGHGFRGGQSWTPNQTIIDALNETYYNAVNALTVSNKRILLGVDVSGSMSHEVGGTAMTATQFANVLALTMLKVEPYAEVVGFSNRLHSITYGRRSSLDEVLKTAAPGGGTDCSLPLQYALKGKIKFDAIVILTDNESWAGKEHSFQLLDTYRKTVNKDVKVIEVASVSNPHTQYPDDVNLLRVVGFDGAVLNVIGKFIGMTFKDEEVA